MSVPPASLGAKGAPDCRCLEVGRREAGRKGGRREGKKEGGGKERREAGRKERGFVKSCGQLLPTRAPLTRLTHAMPPPLRLPPEAGGWVPGSFESKRRTGGSRVRWAGRETSLT